MSTTRPARRTSALAGQSPITATPAIDTNTTNNGNAGIPDNAGNGGNADTYSKVTARLPSELLDEARGAWWHTAARTDVGSFSDWIRLAIEDRLAQQRNAYNNGAPFEAVTPGRIPRGPR